MKKIFFFLLIFLCIQYSLLNAQNFPFPQHITYTNGTIQPNNYTQAQMDVHAQDLYDNWKNAYLNNSCGNNQYYVESWANNNVSEGLGYGMMITAFMGGYDANAQSYFDGQYNFYKAHPSNINNDLMAWNQANCTSVNGVDSASDGDIDIAYALLLAHAQWGSNGAIDYQTAANDIIVAIMDDDINPQTWSVKLGDWASSGSPNYYYATRPSDFIIDHFRQFETATGNTNWTNVINTCYDLVEDMQTNHSPVAKLVPDFILNVNTNPTPAYPSFLEGQYDGHYSYNSCRVPWRLGTDYLQTGDTRAKTAVDNLTNWLKNSTSNNIANLSNGYLLDGTKIFTWSDPAYKAPWAVAAMSDPAHQNWLNDLYGDLVNSSFSSSGYYENSIKMLCMLVISKNYWTPSGTPPPPPTDPTASFTATPTSGIAPLTVNFDASNSSDPNGNALSYSWDFGNGNSGTGMTASYTFTNIGTYTVTLTVDNGNGGTDTEVATITATGVPIPPTISISAPTDGSSHSFGNVVLEATASDVDGSVSSVQFLINSNSISASNSSGNIWSANWSANAPGSYQIIATATDNEGLTASTSITITINAPPCTNVSNHWLSDLTSVSAQVNWTEVYGALKYKVRYREIGDSWTPQVISAPTSNLQIVGLMEETDYEYQVKVKCPSGWTSWTSKTPFSTPANQIVGDFVVTSEWETGYCADLTITNNGTTAVDGWTLIFDLDATISSLWNGAYTVNGNTYTISDVGWNANIPAGGSIMIGFCADYSGSILPPTNALFNGAAIDINNALPIPPNVVITTPNNGDSFVEGSTVTLTADSFDPDGTVTSLDFDVNGTAYSAANIGGDTWETTYIANSVGNNIITATSTDNEGNSTSISINIAITSNGGGGGSSVLGHFQVNNNWGTGYCANITLTNNGSTAVNGWTLIFDLNANIYNLWNGSYTTNGNTYTVSDVGWNATIQPGASRTFGFCAYYTGSITPPTNATFNDAPIIFTSTSNLISNPNGISAAQQVLPGQLKLVPNPTRNHGELWVNLPIESDLRIDIFNNTGQLLKTYIEQQKEAGIQTFDLNVDEFDAGIYWISIKGKVFSKMEKLVVMK